MVDMTDSKSVDRKVMGVQVPSPVPLVKLFEHTFLGVLGKFARTPNESWPA